MARGLYWAATNPIEAAYLIVATLIVSEIAYRSWGVVYAWRLRRARRQLVDNQQRWKTAHRG